MTDSIKRAAIQVHLEEMKNQITMKIKFNEIDGIYLFAVSGRIDSISSNDLESALYEALDKSAWIILDLTDVEYISSSGLRVLLAGKKRLKLKNGDLILTSLQPVVRDVFEITGLSRIFSIKRATKDALQIISSEL